MNYFVPIKNDKDFIFIQNKLYSLGFKWASGKKILPFTGDVKGLILRDKIIFKTTYKQNEIEEYKKMPIFKIERQLDLFEG